MMAHDHTANSKAHKCPKTAIWIGKKLGDDETDSESLDHRKLMQIQDVFRLEKLASGKYFFPVMIRGEDNCVYELSDIITFMYTGGGKSPATRKRFRLEELEPVRYPGFDGYERTIEALTRVTRQNWKGIPDPYNVPLLADGKMMDLPVLNQDEMVDAEEKERLFQEEKDNLEKAIIYLHAYQKSILNMKRSDPYIAESVEILAMMDQLFALYQGHQTLIQNYKKFPQNSKRLGIEIQENHNRIEFIRQKIISQYYMGDEMLQHADQAHSNMLDSERQMTLFFHRKQIITTVTTVTGVVGALLILNGLIRWQKNRSKAKRFFSLTG
jgi:hypothetical protein